MRNILTFNRVIALGTQLYHMSRPVLLAAVLLAAAAPSPAQTPPPDVPDVLVMVDSGGEPLDRVSVTYNAPLTDAQARADVASMLLGGGWKASDLTVSTSGQPPTTSAEFRAKGVANWNTGAVYIEPFIVALKRFRLIKVYFKLSETFPFRSLKDYHDKRVDITCTGTGNGVDYWVKINDHSFDRLNLPLIVNPPPAPKKTDNGTVSSQQRGSTIWVCLLVAAAAGVAVFVFLGRTSRKRKE
jgi:hypothetical protein